jgi:hypothetical protein
MIDPDIWLEINSGPYTNIPEEHRLPVRLVAELRSAFERIFPHLAPEDYRQVLATQHGTSDELQMIPALLAAVEQQLPDVVPTTMVARVGCHLALFGALLAIETALRRDAQESQRNPPLTEAERRVLWAYALMWVLVVNVLNAPLPSDSESTDGESPE